MGYNDMTEKRKRLPKIDFKQQICRSQTIFIMAIVAAVAFAVLVVIGISQFNNNLPELLTQIQVTGWWDM